MFSGGPAPEAFTGEGAVNRGILNLGSGRIIMRGGGQHENSGPGRADPGAGE